MPFIESARYASAARTLEAAARRLNDATRWYDDDDAADAAADVNAAARAVRRNRNANRTAAA